MMRARHKSAEMGAVRCSAHGAGVAALLSEMPKEGEPGVEIHRTGLERAQRFYATSERKGALAELQVELGDIGHEDPLFAAESGNATGNHFEPLPGNLTESFQRIEDAD